MPTKEATKVAMLLQVVVPLDEGWGRTEESLVGCISRQLKTILVDLPGSAKPSAPDSPPPRVANLRKIQLALRELAQHD